MDIFNNLADRLDLKNNNLMSELPKMKHLQKKGNLTVKLDEQVLEVYRAGRQNGWDVSEMARQFLVEGFTKNANQLKRPAS